MSLKMIPENVNQSSRLAAIHRWHDDEDESIVILLQASVVCSSKATSDWKSRQNWSHTTNQNCPHWRWRRPRFDLCPWHSIPGKLQLRPIHMQEIKVKVKGHSVQNLDWQTDGHTDGLYRTDSADCITDLANAVGNHGLGVRAHFSQPALHGKCHAMHRNMRVTSLPLKVSN